jgi:hypothetical protein
MKDIKIDIDVICLTKTSNDFFYQMTKNCLSSLHKSEKKYNFKVNLVESVKDSKYSFNELCVNYFSPNLNFNYNQFLNLCNDFLKSEWVIIVNNDVIFDKDWFSEIIKIHELNNEIKSFSPKDPYHFKKYFPNYFNEDKEFYTGYTISEHVHGWCLVLHKTVWDLVYPFDEQFNMYYQDNDYAEIIKSMNIKHAMVRDSIVYHLGSVTTSSPFTTENEEIKKSELTFRTKWNIF